MRQGLAIGAMALAVAACASTRALNVPAALDPPQDQALAMTVHAEGVQIYACRATKNADGFEWTFVAPDADLFDGQGRRLGTHGAGPSWQAQDGSRIIGTVKARVDAPVAGTIPWLLLSTRNDGTDGSFSKVASVQRVNTVGGAAPAGRCGSETRDAVARIAYTADYRLFTAR